MSSCGECASDLKLGESSPGAIRGQDLSKAAALTWLAAISILGLALRAWKLGSLSITFDEFITGASFLGAPSLGTYLDLVRLHTPEQLPVYLAAQYCWARVAGSDIGQLRLLPVMVSLAGCPLLYAFTARMFGRKAGLVAALCLALSPMNIWWSQGIRAYSFVVPIALLSLYSFVRAHDEPGPRWVVVNVVSNFLLVWTLLTTGCLVLLETCFLVVCSRGRLRSVLAWAASNGAVLFSVAVWVWFMPHLNGAQSGIPELSHAWSALIGNDSLLFNVDLPQPLREFGVFEFSTLMNGALAFFWCCVMAWLAIRLLRILRSPRTCIARLRHDAAARNAALLLLVIVASPFIAFVTLQALQRLLFFPRYTLYAWPALYAAAGGFIAAMPGRWLRRTAVAALTVLYLYQIPFLAPVTLRADWLGAARHLSERAKPEDLVLVGGELLSCEVFAFNVRHGHVPLAAPVLGALTAQAAVDACAYYLGHRDAGDAQQSQRAVWLLLQVGEKAEDSFPQLEQALVALGFAFESRAFVAGDTILAYRFCLESSAGARDITPSRDALSRPLHVNERLPFNLVDYDVYLNQLETLGLAVSDQEREFVLEKLRRVALHMFFDSWDASLWSMFLIGAGEGELGLAVAREAVTSSPTFGPAHLALGAALEYEGQRRGSVQAFQASFSCDPPLESIFGGIVDRLAEGNDPVAAARELARLEEIGIVCMHVPFVELYRRRFRPQDAPLPLGIYAPTQRSYEQACGMFARNARRSTSLTEAGEAHLEFLKLLWASGL